jgi:hypothetical protein
MDNTYNAVNVVSEDEYQSPTISNISADEFVIPAVLVGAVVGGVVSGAVSAVVSKAIG